MDDDTLVREIAEAHAASPDREVVRSNVGDVEAWRRAARRAGRLLGWKVRTRASGRVVHVVGMPNLSAGEQELEKRRVLNRVDEILRAHGTNDSG
jgi:hypothetical protein